MEQNATNGPISTQTTAVFPEDGVELTSKFDSGNLAKFERTGSKTYDLWIGPDCCGTQAENSCRSWFYFRVSVAQPSTLRFTIKNLNLQFKVFREGMKPVHLVEDQWERIPGPVSFELSDVDSNFMELTFTELVSKTTYFAFTYPWSHSEHLELIRQVKDSCLARQIYFHEENLIFSLERRECEILTISSFLGIQEEREKNIMNLYPGNSERAKTFINKKVMLLTARVHPGETQGSFMVNGFMKFIVSDDPRAGILRDYFVFKIVPMMNPDAVFRGHYRTDTRGINLNRFYTSPSLVDHPTVYGVKEIFMAFKENVYLYVDLHGHATKKGCFVYGNYMEFTKEIESFLFAKLMAINCINFDYEGSNFTEKNMRAKDKRGLSKEGSGRVALFKNSGLPRCYTLECNFNTGKVINNIESSGLPEPNECDNSHPMYSKSIVEYSIGIYEDVGRAIAVSMLDNILKNPFSRVLKTDPDLKLLKLEVAGFIASQAPFRFDPVIKKASKNKEELSKLMQADKKKEKVEKPVEKRVSVTKTTELVRAPRVSKTLQPVITESEIRPSKRIIIAEVNKNNDSTVVPIKNYAFPPVQKIVNHKKNLVVKKQSKPPQRRNKIRIDNQSGLFEKEIGNVAIIEVMAE
jgi:hypothetical protein